MASKILEFVAGAGVPVVLSGLWFGVVRKLVSPATAVRIYQTSPYKYATPALLVIVCGLIALFAWAGHRYASYGALIWVFVALVMSLMILLRGAKM